MQGLGFDFVYHQVQSRTTKRAPGGQNFSSLPRWSSFSLAEWLSRVPGLVTGVAVNLLGWVRLVKRSVECDGQPYSAIKKSKCAVKTLPLWGDKDHHQSISRVTRKSVLEKLRVTSRELDDESIVVK